jgi:hypothetical protein
MNRVCPNCRHENITLWSSSNLFILSDRHAPTFVFVIETPIHVYVNVNILLVGTSTCKTWNIKTEIYY